MTCPHEANVVVVGADDSEISFTFDALVESEDGDYMSSKVQYVNNDILTDCVLAKDFRELRISCGDMRWVLSSDKTRIFPGGKFGADAQEGTEATACVEIEQFDADGADEDDLAVSTVVIDTSPGADFLDTPAERGSGSKASSLGKISYKVNGEMHYANCLPYGRVEASSGQVFERVDSWLQSIKRPHLSMMDQ